MSTLRMWKVYNIMIVLDRGRTVNKIKLGCPASNRGEIFENPKWPLVFSKNNNNEGSGIGISFPINRRN